MRVLEKFAKLDDSDFYTIPLGNMETDTQQGLRIPFNLVAGAHYLYDQRGVAEGLKEPATETARIVIANSTVALVEQEYDTLKQKLFGFGLGKLYNIDAAANERWSYSRLASMPAAGFRSGNLVSLAVALNFRRQSDCFDTAQTVTVLTPNADPYTAPVTNAGNAKVYNPVITIKGTFTNPSVTNLTTGYSFSTTRDGSNANHWLEIDCGKFTVRFSTDGGASWSDDIALFSRGAYQAQFMVLGSGSNSIQIGGCNSATVTFAFYGAWQ